MLFEALQRRRRREERAKQLKWLYSLPYPFNNRYLRFNEEMHIVLSHHDVFFNCTDYSLLSATRELFFDLGTDDQRYRHLFIPIYSYAERHNFHQTYDFIFRMGLVPFSIPPKIDNNFYEWYRHEK